MDKAEKLRLKAEILDELAGILNIPKKENIPKVLEATARLYRSRATEIDRDEQRDHQANMEAAYGPHGQG